MKSQKIISAGLLALALGSSAFATDQVIKITGSTAYRKALYAAIVDQLVSTGGCSAAFKGSNLESANQAYFDNNQASPNHIVVQCCMAGSIGGVNWVANELDVATAPGADTTKAWMSSANARSAADVTTVPGHASGGTSIGSPAWEAASTANVTMSDSYQDSCQFNSNDFPALNEASNGSSGIVAFSFAKGKLYDNVNAASYARLTNVSPLAFKYLAANGTARLSLFTGNSSDTGIDVVLVGRDNDSGTRLVTMYETAYGTDTTTAVQYRAFAADGTTDVGLSGGTIDQLKNADLVGANPAGLNGYPSGGQVKTALQASGTAGTGVVSANGRPAILVAYLGTADSPGDAQLLTYNGNVVNSTTVIPTQYGQYSFWSNEHMYFGSGGNTPSAAATATMVAINGKIRVTYAGTAGGLTVGSMHASRSVEGGPVTPLP